MLFFNAEEKIDIGIFRAKFVFKTFPERFRAVTNANRTFKIKVLRHTNRNRM